MTENIDSFRKAKLIQRFIALVFLILGGWCLVSPMSVVQLTILPEHQAFTMPMRVAIGAFGAQACLAGLFVWFSVFTRTTYLAYGLALLPFFAFDWWFYFVDPLFNELILLDAVGNLIMLALCVCGYKLLRNASEVDAGS
ncbi:MAG: hypothetical protein IBJ12_02920 [Sphingomonadaceae bacterium]|nr:hypothetical protein [Sphingomonadaceae bacterium]